MCDFTFSVPFTWFAQTSTTQQTRNKSCTKNTKRTNIQTHNKGITIHIKRLQKNITISTINSHILQKKKILQTENYKHNSNCRSDKSDKEHEQWVIILWNIFRKLWFLSWFLCVFYVILLFFMICNVYCLSYAVFLFVLKVIVWSATRVFYVFHLWCIWWFWYILLCILIRA